MGIRADNTGATYEVTKLAQAMKRKILGNKQKQKMKRMKNHKSTTKERCKETSIQRYQENKPQAIIKDRSEKMRQRRKAKVGGMCQGPRISNVPCGNVPCYLM